ncbi:MAG TPA: hypothetical protein DCM59_08395 [Clostridium sp.]|nr:hypothetical protein [Clostridium sp.]
MFKKGIICLLLTVSMVFTATFTAQGAEIGKVDSLDFSYVSTNQIFGEIPDFIALRIGADETCPWTEDTTWNDPIPVYDFEDNINGYIFNLTTGGAKAGYIFYESFGEPGVQAFGYEGEYFISYVDGYKENPDCKLIYTGGSGFLFEKDNEIYDLYTCEKTTFTQDQLVIKYKESRAENLQAIQQENATMENAISPAIAYPTVYNITNVFNNYVPSTTEQLARWSGIPMGDGNCSPTSAINLIYYYTECRNNDLRNGSIVSTYTTLVNNYVPISSGSYQERFNGLSNYFIHIGKPYAGRDCVQYPSWDWMKANLYNNHNISISIDTSSYSPGSTGGHAMNAVGYDETGTRYLRVVDGWSTHVSNFYRYQAGDAYCRGGFYFRWY